MMERRTGFCAAVAVLSLACSTLPKHQDPKPQPDAGVPDFSALDPARCPAVASEDLHGFMAGSALETSGSWQEDKSFYLFVLFDSSAEAKSTLAATPALAAIANQRAQALDAANKTCGADNACLGAAAKWSDADVASVGDALVSVAGSSQAMQSVATRLRASGMAQLHAAMSDAELLRSAWLDAAFALNLGWDDHVAPLPSTTVASLVSTAAQLPKGTVFHAPLLQIVLGALIGDGRDECARYEPLADGENHAALVHLPEIDFSKYPFTVVLVPGQGPMDLDHPLDPEGRVRADQAAARYQALLAPLIALTGGHVHPDRTPFAEALEMKQYLMATYAIPESAILVDPHARHTTTNLRNVSRQLYRYGIPVDRPVLLTSDWLQTIYIAGASDTDVFGKRCKDELGYLPYRGLVQLDDLDDCLIPSAESLYSDARDLLDP